MIATLQWLALALGTLCPDAAPLALPDAGTLNLPPDRIATLQASEETQPGRIAWREACRQGHSDPRPSDDRRNRQWLALDHSLLIAADKSGWGLHVPALGFRELCVHWPLPDDGWDSRCLQGAAGPDSADRTLQSGPQFIAPTGLAADRPILISAQSPFFQRFPIQIAEADTLLAERNRAHLYVGAAYGILAALVSYGLLLLGSARNLSLLFFSGYFGLFAVALFLAEGLHVSWFGLGSRVGGVHLSYALMGLAFLSGALFLGHFLRSRESDHWLHGVLWTAGLVAPALMFLAAFRLDWALPASEAGALIFALGGLTAAGRGVFHGRRNAGPLLMGFTILMLALVINSLVRIGWLPSPGMSSLDILKSALLLGGVSLGLAAEREFANLRRQRDRASLLAETHQRIALYRVDFDTATGLPNRRRFFRLLSERVANAIEGQGVGLIRIVLLDFRKLRHLHGQEMADELLRHVVGKLQSFETSGRVLGRTESDEFSLLVPLPGKQSAAEAVMDALAGEIRESLSEPLASGSDSIRIQHAMGGSIYPMRANSGEQLLLQAEAGVFESREIEGLPFHLYGRGDEPALMERWSLGRRLAQALEDNAIHPHYQPIVDLDNQGIRQLEALARWTDDELGEVPPSVFIPVAESLGLIEQLGHQMVRQACRDAAAWQREGILGQTRLSLNLSPLQLRDEGFEDWLLQTLAEHGLSGHQVSLEVTENTLVENLATARVRLQRLVDNGVGISVDDFGVGYSSLSYIRELPINTLKIDRSFMTRLDHSDAEREIVRGLLHMAQKLNLSVVAEGIEHRSQAAFLARHRCKLGQGFLFGRPVSAKEMGRRLRRENPVPRIRNR